MLFTMSKHSIVPATFSHVLCRVGFAIATAFLSACALPQPTNIERQDFIPQREVLLASIVKKAQEDYARGRLLDTELGLRQALLMAPGTTQIILNLGRTLARNGQVDEAQQLFATVLERKKDDLPLINFVGESFFEGGHYEKALTYFIQARDIIEEKQKIPVFVEPSFVDITFRNLSTVLFRSGETIEALCAMHRAFDIAQTPDNVIRLVRLESARGAYANGEALISNFITLNPSTGDGRLFLLRAMMRLALGQRDLAIEDMNAASKRDDTIAEYALELRLLTEILIESTVSEEESSDDEDEDAPAEYLTGAKRLYVPLTVLELLDNFAHQKEENAK